MYLSLESFCFFDAMNIMKIVKLSARVCSLSSRFVSFGQSYSLHWNIGSRLIVSHDSFREREGGRERETERGEREEVCVCVCVISTRLSVHLYLWRVQYSIVDLCWPFCRGNHWQNHLWGITNALSFYSIVYTLSFLHDFESIL